MGGVKLILEQNRLIDSLSLGEYYVVIYTTNYIQISNFNPLLGKKSNRQKWVSYVIVLMAPPKSESGFLDGDEL